jgi:hypothetical protein
MPYHTRILATAAVLAAALTTLALAQSQPARGRVLVLENEGLLEGEVERHGEQYCVRHDGGELWLPAARVRHLCASREEAFAFVARETNLKDAHERLRLAHWCQRNGLHDEAVRQAGAAVDLRPNYVDAAQLLTVLKRPASEAAPKRAPGPAAPESAPLTDVSLETLSTFTTRVQPILMNTCVRCHCGHQGGAFDLMRSHDSLSSNRRATMHNLAAVLKQVDAERPELSPLLIKAVSAHWGGDRQSSPLKGRESVPFQTLQEWVRKTVADNPHLRPAAASSAVPALKSLPEEPARGFAAAAPAADGQGPAAAPVARVATPAPLPPPVRQARPLKTGPNKAGKDGQTPAPALPVLRGGQVVGQTGAPAGPQQAAPAQPKDPYDADEFNRQAAPGN